MRKPKEMTIFGRKFKVIYKSKGGSSFNLKKNIIIIDTEYREDYEEELLHELLEAILVENLYRYYTNESSSEYLFIFNHTRFCSIVKQFTHILKINKLLK